MLSDCQHPWAFAMTPMALALTLMAATLVTAEPAWSQIPPAASGAVSAPPAEASAPPPGTAVNTAPHRENPGLINEIGKLLERRPLLFPALKPAEAPAGGVEGTVNDAPPVKVPSFEKGREKCPASENGASDCKAAADALCRAKGYAQGKNTDTDAVERCSAEALLLSGRKSAPGACRTDYFVTRAWCQ